MPEYVLITPAHNEEAFIAQTIESIIAQTKRPLRWIIVDDCSTDRTLEIAKVYAAKCDFLRTISIKREPGRHFGNKVFAFNLGIAQLENVSFDFLANLDADVSVDPTYFEGILSEFARYDDLGIAGGMVHSSVNGRYISQKVSLDSVAGAVQTFRRKCFEDVGGYVALPGGGVDSVAEITARKMNWVVRTFPRYRVMEHRRTGSTTSGALGSRIKEGRLYYSLGYSPSFFLFRCLYRSVEQPFVLGSLAELLGFLSGVASGKDFILHCDVVRHLRNEQRSKLKVLLRKYLTINDVWN